MTTMQELKTEVDSLKKDIECIKENTAELLEAWTDAKGALKALAWVGSTARWIVAVSGACALFYFFLTGKK